MLYKELLELRSDSLKLSEDEVNYINNILKKSNIKIKKRKLTPEILKLKELNNKKKSISSKINQVINKISIINYNDIVIEFIQNVNLDDDDYLDTFNEIFFNKILIENNFAKSFAYFFKDLSYGVKYFYDKELSINNYEKLLNNYENESKSENLLTFIYYLIENQYFNNNLYHKIFLELYNNNKFYLVYVWLNLNKNVLNKYKFYLDQIDKSNLLLDNRTKILLENLNKPSQEKVIVVKNTKNKLEIEIENIFEEYLELEDEDEIKLYIKENLKSSENKLLFKNMCLKHKNKKINKLVIYI
jgi:hypothetical protein